MSDFLIGQIRTWVPIAVGAFFAWLLTVGVEIDGATQSAAVIALTGFIQALYYTGIRLLAEKWPQAGIFLGYNKAPAYNE